jgi:hypothetical protein
VRQSAEPLPEASMPAHTDFGSAGSTASQRTFRLVISSPGRLQEAPPSSLRQTPPPLVAA